MSQPKCPLTTTNGAPIAEDQNSISAGARGALTFDNFRMFEKLAHFNRERIPERVVNRTLPAFLHRRWWPRLQRLRP
ncbi:MAG: catalase [Halothiobacillaceae bacterium]|nr:MAG: catalase [Halothiobacillaceae bacterium]